MKMTITKLLYLTGVIGLSYGYVHHTRRKNTDMVATLQSEDGTPIRGLYMAEPRTLRSELSESCTVEYNTEQDSYDYTCGCNQRLGNDRPIGNLILNNTDCTSSLWVLWSEMEAGLSPKSITFVGVDITLTNQTLDEGVNSSIKKVTFVNSNITDLTEDAFKGLKELEELRFIGCNIIKISTHAVRDLKKLNTIEIRESIIGTIYENAFLNLPAINDFAISFSKIDEIEGQGINLEYFEGGISLCYHSARIEPFNDTEIARQIQGALDFDLPSSGRKRFLLYQNKITSIRSNAVVSNAFGFLIVAENDIKLIEATAFNMQLKLRSPCKITAAVFASNNITKLSDKAFAGIHYNIYSTFISLNKNTFDEVHALSFQTKRNLQIFTVDDNILKCDCKNLSEFLKHQSTSAFSPFKYDLKRQIIDKANCTTGEGLTNFKYTCEEFAASAPHSGFTEASGTKSTLSH